MHHAMRLWLAFLSLVLSQVDVFAGDRAGPRLVAEFDCTKDYPPQEYFGHADVAVVDSPLGRYRQAGTAVNSRFGYRFKTNVGKPHLLVVHYPDDRRRNMALLDGTCYGAVRSTPVGALARVRSASEIRLLSPSRRGSGQPPG